MGLVYQNTGHGTQGRVPNVIPRTMYRLHYMGTRGPGLQMEARNTGRIRTARSAVQAKLSEAVSTQI